MVDERHWLALCLLTETNEPHEMVPVAWVIRNRVEKVGRFPNSYFGVITQPMQFSYFNRYQPIENTQEDFDRVKGPKLRYMPAALKAAADEVALHVMNCPRWQAPFGPQCDHYWSPVSMIPEGRDPTWASHMHRVFELPGVDPWRFKFAQEND